MNFLIANVIGIVAVFGIAGSMLKTWLSHQEKMKALAMNQQSLASSDQRLERVEQAVEAVAIEIERISEGQRFVTKLLNERSRPLPGGVTAPAPRVDTPH